MIITERKPDGSEPMPKLMHPDEAAEKFAEAAKLLNAHGEMGAAYTLKNLLDGEVKYFDIFWLSRLTQITDAAARTLGDDHLAICLIREVLNCPWPIGLDESPDDPEDT
jgi:hypothetical protein